MTVTGLRERFRDGPPLLGTFVTVPRVEMVVVSGDTELTRRGFAAAGAELAHLIEEEP